MNSHNCLCFIVPPRLLERAARSDDREIREAALTTMGIDNSIRAVRMQEALLAPATSRSRMGQLPRRGVRSLVELYAGEPDRVILDAKQTENIRQAEVVRREGDPPTQDVSADEAYDGLGVTYDLYWKIFHRNAIDGAGGRMRAVVHYGRGYGNAFWDGEQMVFGDGDGKLFTGFTKAIDVIGHELTHGMLQHAFPLQYIGQPGALNESIADVFGSLVKQYHLGQTADKADWLIGAGIFGPEIKGEALRSMKAPGTAYEGDDQPSHMKDYVVTTSDNGGVHINSGIPNHAFYLAATAIGGNAWEKAGWIWYNAIHDPRLTPVTPFPEFAFSTVYMAAVLFGQKGPEQIAVAEAWKAVGVELAKLPSPDTIPK